MDAINAVISDLEQQKKALEEEKETLSRKVWRNRENPPPFEEVVAAFEQDPAAALEKYRPIRDRVLEREVDRARESELRDRAHALFVEILGHQNTRARIAKQDAADERVGQYEGLSESELTRKARELHSRLYQYHRYSDPHDDTGDIEKEVEARLDAVVILLERKNVHTSFANNAIAFSNTAIANDVAVKRRKRRQ